MVFARDAVLVGQVFGGFAHGLRAIKSVHFGVDKAPAEGGVVELAVAAKGFGGLGQGEWRAGHVFHSTGQQEVAFVALNGTCCMNHRRESARAKTVHGFGRNAWRKPREQGGHARHVSVVFARLIRAAHKGIIKCGPVQPRIALD